MLRIPLIEDLASEAIPAGSNLLVEYDASSQWYAAAASIVAGRLKGGGEVEFYACSQPPNTVRSQLSRLGFKTSDLETNNLLRIYDVFSTSVGLKSNERYSFETLKVADLSLWVSKERMRLPPKPNLLRVVDNLSYLDRFNDERVWVEFVLTRMIPQSQQIKSTAIRGIISGAHSDWVYKQLEAVHDAIVDVRLEQAGEETRNLIRIRIMRNVSFDGRWHRFKVGDNFEVILDT